MRTYGLIGYPLSHSFSAEYFSEKFFRENIHDCRYDLFPLEKISELTSLLNSNETLRGLNVTIPFKERILPFLSFVDAEAKEAGAVNTIKIIDRKKHELHGYNTDIAGFEFSLKPLLRKEMKKALILGSGGASKAVALVCRKLGIDYSIVSRTKKHTESLDYSEITEGIMKSHLLIVNATPSGMFPEILSAPRIPYQFLTKKHLLYDLVYNPGETLFMKQGIEKGASVKNGLEMLCIQAEKSWEIWNGPEE